MTIDVDPVMNFSLSVASLEFLHISAVKNMQTYLNTEDAAAYLGIKERKLYELVAHGAVPCSKVTGKWLFPRVALDRWVEGGLVLPEGFAAASPPPIVGGSHDPLLEWALRRSGSGLALLSEGSGKGLERLARDEVAMAGLHLHSAGDGVDANIASVAARGDLRDVVIIAFARREQGLVTAPGNPLRLARLADIVTTQARIGMRQVGAGAQQLLDKLAIDESLDLKDGVPSAGPFATGNDLAFAIRAGDIDCGMASRATASANGLGFVPLAWESFDLVMRRRTFFEPGPQSLLALMRGPELARHAAILSGYDVSVTGAVRFNR